VLEDVMVAKLKAAASSCSGWQFCPTADAMDAFAAAVAKAAPTRC
jgi:hypothetical protein